MEEYIVMLEPPEGSISTGSFLTSKIRAAYATDAATRAFVGTPNRTRAIVTDGYFTSVFEKVPNTGFTVKVV